MLRQCGRRRKEDGFEKEKRKYLPDTLCRAGSILVQDKAPVPLLRLRRGYISPQCGLNGDSLAGSLWM